MRLLPAAAPLMVAMIMTTDLAAQTGLRVRITGVDEYRLGDIVHIGSTEIRGTGILSVTGDFIEVRLPDVGVVTIPKAGRRVAGRALAADRTIVTLVPEKSSTPIRVPADAIARLEVSRGGGSRGRAIGVGIAAGVGGFFAGAWLGMAACGIDCDAGVTAAAFAAGIGLGGLAGARIGRERWDDLPATQLADKLPR
jgi:hypothetical protein